MRPRHIRQCVEIEKVLFPGDDPWSARAFHAELDLGGHYLVALAEPGDSITSAGSATAGPPGPDEVLGYAGLAVLGPPHDPETSVHTIGVRPDQQGRGLGTVLLRALLARADELAAPVFLEVRTDNDSAIRLYERHGFDRIGVRRGYYQPSGADAYTMKRQARRRQEVAG